MLQINTHNTDLNLFFYTILDDDGEILDSYNGFTTEQQAYDAGIEAAENLGID